MNNNNLLKPLPKTEDGRAKIALVYQAGIANVFRVDSFNLADFGRNATRIYQGDFRTAEAMARGAGECGAIVHSLACNRAGDIATAVWTDDLEEQPFSNEFRPVFFTIGV